MRSRRPPMHLLTWALSAAGAAVVLAATPLEVAVAHHRAGRLDEALAGYRSIVGDPHSEPAAVAAARNAACVLLNDRGEFAAALAECREAERIRRELGDDSRLALTLNNLALAHQYLGEIEAAERLLREALDIDRRLGEPEEEAIVLANLAALAIDAGRYGVALDRLEQAERLTQDHPTAPWASEQRRVARLNRAVVLERLGAHREALQVLLELAREPAAEGRHAAALAANLGVLYRNLGDPRQAARELSEAARRFREQGDRAGLANALLNLGQVEELHLRGPERAGRLYSDALDAAAAGGDVRQEALARLFLGRLLASGGRESQAREELEQALARARAAGDPEITWSALGLLATQDRRSGQPDQALTRLEAAIFEIEAVRSGAGRRPEASAFLADKRAIYGAAVDLAAERALQSGRREDRLAALALVQRAKARELLDFLGGAGRPPLGPAELGQLADQPAQMLEYYLGEPGTWRFGLGDGRLELTRVGDSRDLIARADRVHLALSRREAPEREDLEQLGVALLSGLGGQGRERAPIEIAADGRLRYLPFDLLAPAPEKAPLAHRSGIVQWPSLSLRAARAPGVAALTFAGFGAIAPPSARDEGARSLYAARFALLPLPASARELESAAAALRGPARLSLGSEATEATLAALGPGGARVLHFATHAVLEERLSSGAVLFLAPDADHDGLVSAGEIVELQLGSDLVVLAACRSGLGTAVDGRALSSLPGAFLAAGAGGVVASLWEVGDAASAALMSQFYFELGRGARPAQALATAKRRLRADPRWADPSHWAAWILVGDPPPVVTGWRHRLPWIGVALFAALALGAWIYSRAGSTRSSEASEAAITRPDAS